MPDPETMTETFDYWSYEKAASNIETEPDDPYQVFYMPEHDVEATAHFKLWEFTVTVVNGTLSTGETSKVFHPGETVGITCTPPDGYAFDKWTTDAWSLDVDDLAQTDSFIMPYEDVEITANFKAKTYHDITVEKGTAVDDKGNPVTRAATGDKVTLIAEKNTKYQRFDRWIFSPELEEEVDPTKQTLTITMPDTT